MEQSDGERGERGPVTDPAAPRCPGLVLERPLGDGALGDVWAARDPARDRAVAVKLLPAAAAERQAARFRREVAAAARLAHPAIVPVHAAGQAEDGRPFYVMDLVAGRTLREALAAGALGPRAVAAAVARLARALEHAHDRGVVHRGVASRSVVVDERGEARLIDFGLASLEPPSTPEAAGAPARVAPEVARGEVREAGPPADVWALGVLLHEALAGGPPEAAPAASDAPSPSPAAAAARAGRPAVDAELDRITRRALAPALADRYATARELALDLEAWLAGVPPPPPPSRGGRAVVVAFVILATLVAACLAILVGFKGEAARLPRDRPPPKRDDQ